MGRGRPPDAQCGIKGRLPGNIIATVMSSHPPVKTASRTAVRPPTANLAMAEQRRKGEAPQAASTTHAKSTNVSAILSKLGVRTRGEAVREAVRSGLVRFTSERHE